MSVIEALGRWLHPEKVTEAWYLQNCPPHLDTRNLSRWTFLRWRFSCWLRKVDPWL